MTGSAPSSEQLGDEGRHGRRMRVRRSSTCSLKVEGERRDDGRLGVAPAGRDGICDTLGREHLGSDWRQKIG